MCVHTHDAILLVSGWKPAHETLEEQYVKGMSHVWHSVDSVIASGGFTPHTHVHGFSLPLSDCSFRLADISCT